MHLHGSISGASSLERVDSVGSELKRGMLVLGDKVTLAETGPEGLEDAEGLCLRVGLDVVAVEEFLHSASGLHRVIVRDRGEEVVYDVGVVNVVQGEVVEGAKIAVHGGECTAEIRPRCRGVVRETSVCVLEQGNHHEPVVDDEVRGNVGEGKEAEGPLGGDEVEGIKVRGQHNVGDDDADAVGGCEDGGRGHKVVGRQDASLGVATARGVHD